MFYSQFILAKKGPLGTIWIAAHLERKLRKNQVADTDIGVSVDSILFPDVPIALRLSSHLLLGVVRIYSRKVNYLFDDCSEALLKIKQAFRSAAVDLPPEESTAPYHSITLPETFDLDDFELPDNEILQGNFADHHVSAREQITLQDTMDGVVYSTSQFGLDERFGDGDGGQIDLDLDQGNLLEKVAAPLHDRVQDDDPEESAQPLTPFEVDMTEDILSSTPKAVLKSCTSKNQVEDLNKSSPFTEYAEAPSTPGLVQEASLCSVQEGMLSSDHLEAEAQNLLEPVEIECRGDLSDKYDNYHGNRSSVDEHMHDKINEKSNSSIPSKENGYLFVDMEVEEAKTDGYSKSNLEQLEASNPKSPVSMSVNALEKFSHSPEGMKNDITATKEPSVSITNQFDEKCEGSEAMKFAEAVEPFPCFPGPESDKCKSVEFSLDMEMASSREELIPFNSNLNEEHFDSNLNEEHFNSNLNEEHSVSFGDKDGSNVVERIAADADVPVVDKNQILQTLLAGNQADGSVICEQLSSIPPKDLLDSANRSVDMELSVPENYVECVDVDVNRPALDKNQILQPFFGLNVCEQLNNLPPNDLLDSANRSIDVELSAPEKLLSVPDEISEKHLLVESTPNKEALQNDQTADLSYMSGRKRTFSESTLTEQANLLKSAEDSYFNRTETTIPGDEDLLSSILVGRRSLVLKMKPTPVPPTSSKRAKTADRSNASKRKVLVDDSLILHGDTIRQQLTSTEDLRRLRKKAPCTLPEIAIIQRHFLEDEIFSEPIFTGVSRVLLNTYKGAYDVSGTKICEHAKAVAPAEASKDIQSPIKPNVYGETEVEVTVSPAKPSVSGEAEAELIGGPHNIGETLQEQVIEAVVQSDGQQLELLESQVINFETEGSKLEPLEKIPDMDTDKANVAADCSLVSEPGSQILVDSLSEDMSHLPQNSPAELNLIDKGSPGTCLKTDVPSVLEIQSLNTNDYENVTSSVDPIVENGVNCTEFVQSDVQAVMAEPESKAGDKGFMNERIPDSSVDLREDLLAYQYPNRHEDDGTSLTPQLGVSDQCHNMSLNGDGTVGEFGRSGIETMTEDKSQAMQLQCNIMDPADSHHGSVFHLQEHKEDPSSASLNYKNSSFQDDHAGRNEEIPIPNQSPFNNYDDFENMAVADDTEFLNVDDDDMDQDDEYMGDPEEAQLLENIGWSSRTRAVAKYLQTLFNKEDVLGREVLSMDNLLARKTRKEASRLFFESLVLKTRDYIQVEQEKPFDNINIRPRMKLMKSTF